MAPVAWPASRVSARARHCSARHGQPATQMAASWGGSRTSSRPGATSAPIRRRTSIRTEPPMVTHRLSQIAKPEDLHGLTDEELQQVAQDVREHIIDTVG